jgi:hypothetical protein
LRWIIIIKWYVRDTIYYMAKVVGRVCSVDPEDMFRQIKTETKALGGGSSSWASECQGCSTVQTLWSRWGVCLFVVG